MAPAVLLQYTPLDGASTASLPLHGRPRDEHVSIPGRLDTELDEKDDERDEGDGEDDTGRTGLLSGRDKEDEEDDAGANDLEEEGRRLTGAETVPKRRRRVVSWQTSQSLCDRGLGTKRRLCELRSSAETVVCLDFQNESLTRMSLRRLPGD